METKFPDFPWLFPDEFSKCHDTVIGQIHHSHLKRETEKEGFPHQKATIANYYYSVNMSFGYEKNYSLMAQPLSLSGKWTWWNSLTFPWFADLFPNSMIFPQLENCSTMLTCRLIRHHWPSINRLSDLYGISRQDQIWFSSYLENMHQSVKIKHTLIRLGHTLIWSPGSLCASESVVHSPSLSRGVHPLQSFRCRSASSSIMCWISSVFSLCMAQCSAVEPPLSWMEYLAPRTRSSLQMIVLPANAASINLINGE